MVTKRIVIVGSGGFAKEVYSYIKYDIENGFLRDVKVKGFVDKDEQSFALSGISEDYLGDEYSCQIEASDYFVVALGFNRDNIRKRIIGVLEGRGAQFLRYVHSNSFVSVTATIEEGAIICPNCIVNSGAVIKKHSVLNIYSSVAHGCLLGAYSILSPYATLNGDVKTGCELFLGTQAAVLAGLTLGDRCRISAGVVLTKNIGDDITVFNKVKCLMMRRR